MDWIPGVSQIKSLTQVVRGDVEGARRTQENFSRQCPGVSQVRSAVEIVSGDIEGSKNTQKHFVKNVNNVTNSVPVVGHAKGVVHSVAGDAKGAEEAFNAANRTTLITGLAVHKTLVDVKDVGVSTVGKTWETFDDAFSNGSGQK